MTFFSRSQRYAVACQVGSLEQHSSPLVVIVDGVVDGDVHGPKVTVLLGVEQGRLVFSSLRNTIAGPTVRAVIASLKPGVGAERIV